jgi:hypothetical protein
MGSWNVLDMLQDRVQICCTCLEQKFQIVSMCVSQAVTSGWLECVMLDADVCGNVENVVGVQRSMVGELCRKCRKACKMSCVPCRRPQERAVGGA